MTTTSKTFVSDTVSRANGQWASILASQGINVVLNKHGTCPSCQGTDRFRFDDKSGSGSHICNQCGAGDGLKLLQKCTNTTPKEAANIVAQCLGIDTSKPVIVDRAALKMRKTEDNKNSEKEAREIKVKTAAKAKAILSSCEFGESEYLKKKGLPSKGLITTTSIHGLSPPALIIPFYREGESNPATLQAINNETKDNKRFLQGTRKNTFHNIDGKDDTVFIGEGYATTLTATLLTNNAGYVAGSSNDIPYTTRIAQKAHPKAKLVILVDSNKAGRDALKKAQESVNDCIGIEPPGDDAKVKDWNDYFQKHGDEQTRKEIQTLASQKEKKGMEDFKYRAEKLDLILNEKGKPAAKSIHNAIQILKFHPDTTGKLGFDNFQKKMMVLGSLPHEKNAPRELNDHDSTQLTAWLELQGLALQESAVWKSIQAVSHDNHFDPLNDYLNSLKWDGKPRIENWLCDYLGAEESDYTKIVGQCFMVGAVARALKPGCKNDTMLILEGEQGAQKSTALKVLFGENFFTDEISKFGSKDAGMQVQGVWCIEAAELTTMSKAEAGDIKAFLSRSTDRFREPYGRTVNEHRRRCVIAGTVNPDGSGYLKDPTGARRFWPVLVGKINIDQLKLDRNQLWAEAKQKFDDDKKWWFEADQEKIARLAQDERTQSDPWVDTIEQWFNSSEANKPHYFSTTANDIMKLCLDLPADKQNQATSNRVAKCLKGMGYKSRVSKVGKGTARRSARIYTRQ